MNSPLTIDLARVLMKERMRDAEHARLRHDVRTGSTSDYHALLRRYTA